MKKIFIIISFLFFIIPNTAFCNTKYKISGRISSSNKPDTVLLFSKSKGIVRQKITNSKFSFSNLAFSTIRNSRFYFFKAGNPLGPLVLKEAGNFKFIALSNRAPGSEKNLSLNLKTKSGYLLNRRNINSKWIGKSKVKNSKFAGSSLGYLGVSSSSFRNYVSELRASTDDVSTDSDLDGVPDVLDIDDDNDGITDDRDSGGGNIISTLYLDFSKTVNAHLNNLNETSISDTLSAENVFSLIMFLELRDSFSSGTGGHVICDPSQVICRSSADGGTTSVYTGVSESNNALRGQVWSNLNADGSSKPNLEVLSFSGSSDKMLVASIQPRTSAFNAGELIIANITNGSRIVGTEVFSILPPVISSPMLVSYNLGSGNQLVDYSNSSQPGISPSNPIVLSSGSITLNFFPPQRRAITGVESDGQFRDIGSSKLGILIGGTGVTNEFTCAGFYSNLSSGISELSSSVALPGGNFFANQGAVLWPLLDSTPDIITTSGGLKTFSVNLSGCIARAGLPAGTYTATLTYAGTDTRFGATRSGQNFYVTIPQQSS